MYLEQCWPKHSKQKMQTELQQSNHLNNYQYADSLELKQQLLNLQQTRHWGSSSEVNYSSQLKHNNFEYLFYINKYTCINIVSKSTYSTHILTSFPKLCSYHTKHRTTLEIPDAKTAATLEIIQYPL